MTLDDLARAFHRARRRRWRDRRDGLAGGCKTGFDKGAQRDGHASRLAVAEMARLARELAHEAGQQRPGAGFGLEPLRRPRSAGALQPTSGHQQQEPFFGAAEPAGRLLQRGQGETGTGRNEQRRGDVARRAAQQGDATLVFVPRAALRAARG